MWPAEPIPLRDTLWQPGGAKEVSHYCEGDRHLRLVKRRRIRRTVIHRSHKEQLIPRAAFASNFTTYSADSRKTSHIKQVDPVLLIGQIYCLLFCIVIYGRIKNRLY